MEKYYVVVAGNGTTSRANLEALLEDHFYAKGAEGVVHIVEEGKLSQGKIFASQFAKDKNKPVFNAGLVESLSTVDVKNTSCFILWSDEDRECQDTLARATDLGIPCFDLAEGLLPITASKGAKVSVTPVIPTAEETTPKVAETPYVEPEDEDIEEDEEDEDDEEGYDEDEAGNLYFGIEAIAKIFAKAIVEEIERVKKGPVT
ncbi:hypothetical protein UFOVP696_46 [uncultured Caudovirales phage]|jgi:hypothetical protein|uniref:Uncharacterized protein n=1 Tax=uncultured Caudovirales phage TaxID=2100421 RepID=A0A6J5MSZ5_9CAUD|nr:hypothetical protein UFOVP429_121 [uncultured Caudovirales phage]CAB4158178.1 hypothetical protein UFOVP696_46 [uncultured Caudovirales phage]